MEYKFIEKEWKFKYWHDEEGYVNEGEYVDGVTAIIDKYPALGKSEKIRKYLILNSKGVYLAEQTHSEIDIGRTHSIINAYELKPKNRNSGSDIKDKLLCELFSDYVAGTKSAQVSGVDEETMVITFMTFAKIVQPIRKINAFLLPLHINGTESPHPTISGNTYENLKNAAHILGTMRLTMYNTVRAVEMSNDSYKGSLKIEEIKNMLGMEENDTKKEIILKYAKENNIFEDHEIKEYLRENAKMEVYTWYLEELCCGSFHIAAKIRRLLVTEKYALKKPEEIRILLSQKKYDDYIWITEMYLICKDIKTADFIENILSRLDNNKEFRHGYLKFLSGDMEYLKDLSNAEIYFRYTDEYITERLYLGLNVKKQEYRKGMKQTAEKIAEYVMEDYDKGNTEAVKLFSSRCDKELRDMVKKEIKKKICKEAMEKMQEVLGRYYGVFIALRKILQN